MSVSNRHILEQGSALGAIGRIFLSSVEQQVRGKRRHDKPREPRLPGPELTASYAPRAPELVRDYVRHVGGDPAAYKGTLPPHLFPQWVFGLASRTLAGLPYPAARVINAGCNFELRAPIPAGEPLTVSARLESIDDDGRRAVMKTRVVTSTKSVKDALVCELFGLVPLPKRDEGGRAGAKPAHKDSPRVPLEAKEVAYFDVPVRAGLDFAKLTGDFNPIHWIPAAARASGFPNVILHGFGTMARTLEGLNRGVFAGDVARLKKWSCRLTRPLVLPGKAGVYVLGREVFVGVAHGGPAFLVGEFET